MNTTTAEFQPVQDAYNALEAQVAAMTAHLAVIKSKVTALAAVDISDTAVYAATDPAARSAMQREFALTPDLYTLFPCRELACSLSLPYDELKKAAQALDFQASYVSTSIQPRYNRLTEPDRAEVARLARAADYAAQIAQEAAIHEMRLQGLVS